MEMQQGYDMEKQPKTEVKPHEDDGTPLEESIGPSIDAYALPEVVMPQDDPDAGNSYALQAEPTNYLSNVYARVSQAATERGIVPDMSHVPLVQRIKETKERTKKWVSGIDEKGKKSVTDAIGKFPLSSTGEEIRRETAPLPWDADAKEIENYAQQTGLTAIRDAKQFVNTDGKELTGQKAAKMIENHTDQTMQGDLPVQIIEKKGVTVVKARPPENLRNTAKALGSELRVDVRTKDEGAAVAQVIKRLDTPTFSDWAANIWRGKVGKDPETMGAALPIGTAAALHNLVQETDGMLTRAEPVAASTIVSEAAAKVGERIIHMANTPASDREPTDQMTDMILTSKQAEGADLREVALTGDDIKTLAANAYRVYQEEKAALDPNADDFGIQMQRLAARQQVRGAVIQSAMDQVGRQQDIGRLKVAIASAYQWGQRLIQANVPDVLISTRVGSYRRKPTLEEVRLPQIVSVSEMNHTGLLLATGGDTGPLTILSSADESRVLAQPRTIQDIEAMVAAYGPAYVADLRKKIEGSGSLGTLPSAVRQYIDTNVRGNGAYPLIYATPWGRVCVPDLLRRFRGNGPDQAVVTISKTLAINTLAEAAVLPPGLAADHVRKVVQNVPDGLVYAPGEAPKSYESVQDTANLVALSNNPSPDVASQVVTTLLDQTNVTALDIKTLSHSTVIAPILQRSLTTALAGTPEVAGRAWNAAKKALGETLNQVEQDLGLSSQAPDQTGAKALVNIVKAVPFEKPPAKIDLEFELTVDDDGTQTLRIPDERKAGLIDQLVQLGVYDRANDEISLATVPPNRRSVAIGAIMALVTRAVSNRGVVGAVGFTPAQIARREEVMRQVQAKAGATNALPTDARIAQALQQDIAPTSWMDTRHMMTSAGLDLMRNLANSANGRMSNEHILMPSVGQKKKSSLRISI